MQVHNVIEAVSLH